MTAGISREGFNRDTHVISPLWKVAGSNPAAPTIVCYRWISGNTKPATACLFALGMVCLIPPTNLPSKGLRFNLFPDSRLNLVLGFSMKLSSGRRVFASALKEDRRRPLERCEVRMLAQVTAIRVRITDAERSRFPWQ